MSIRIVATPPTPVGDIIVAGLARCVHDLMVNTSINPKIRLEAAIANAIAAGVKMAGANLPTQSIVEKLTGGPLNKLLGNLQLPLTSAVNTWVDARYDDLAAAADRRAKANGQ